MITAHPNAPDGLVRPLPSYSPSDFTAVPSLVMCRNTAPLIALAYGLLQRDVPCYVLGRDIGASLISLVRKMHTDNLQDFIPRLAAWAQREGDRAVAENRSPERIYDQRDCLMFFVDSLDEVSQTVPDLIAKIELLFSDKDTKGKTVLSTIHKAKGLEFRRVFILDRHLLPSRYAVQPWQIQQEKNLLHVAITRSMNELFYIRSDDWKQP